MLEVFTFGGGDHIVQILRSVSAWCGGGGFRGMIQVVMVMGLAYALMTVAFAMSWRTLWNWFLQATLMYMCLIVPTTSVKVTDRLNTGLAPAIVDGVPIGLAALASLTSQFGDWMTRTSETVFQMPNALQMSNNGFIYGARLYDKTRQFVFRDPVFEANVEEYIKQCVFYDVMLGFKNTSDIVNAPDVWQAMVSDASNARAMRVLYDAAGMQQQAQAGSNQVMTCAQAAAYLDGRMSQEIDAGLKGVARSIFPTASEALAKSKLEADLPSVTQSFHNQSVSAAGIYKQRALVEAFANARSNLDPEGTDNFAQLRADTQARNTYNGVAQQAMTWVPLLQIVLTCVFYALFPVIFPLFLMPTTGVTAFKGYAMGFFYLAAWGPIYVVLHMIVMSRAASVMAAVAPNGLTIASMAGIEAVNNDVATLAGYMMMSIPVLAAALARGAMGVAGNAGGFLAPASDAASQSQLERTTGNYAYGNVSHQNLTANTMQANRFASAPSYEGGAGQFSVRNAEGTAARSHFDASGTGSTVYDTSGAISRLGFGVQVGSSWVTEARQAASQRREMAQELVESNGQTVSSGTRTFASNTHAVTDAAGSDTRTGTTTTRTASNFAGRNARVEDTASETRGAQSTTTEGTRTDRTIDGGIRASVGGSVEGGFTLPIVGGAKARAGLDASGGVKWSRSDYGDESQGVTDGKSVGTNYSTGRDGGERFSRDVANSTGSGDFTSNTMTNTASSGNERYQQTQEQRSEEARKLLREADNLDRLASFAEQHDYRITEDMTPYIQQQYTEMRMNGTAGVSLPAIEKVNLSDDERANRNFAVGRILQDMIRPDTTRFREEHGLSGSSPDHPDSPGQLQIPDLPTTEAPAGAGGTFPPPSLETAPSGRLNGNRLARQLGMPVKDGAEISNLDPRMAPAMQAVSEEADRLGLSPRAVTSGNDSVHKKGSRHYVDQGLDFRGRDLTVTQGQALERAVGARLGPGYFVDFETSKGKANYHLHVQVRRPR